MHANTFSITASVRTLVKITYFQIRDLWNFPGLSIRR